MPSCSCEFDSSGSGDDDAEQDDADGACVAVLLGSRRKSRSILESVCGRVADRAAKEVSDRLSAMTVETAPAVWSAIISALDEQLAGPSGQLYAHVFDRLLGALCDAVLGMIEDILSGRVPVQLAVDDTQMTESFEPGLAGLADLFGAGESLASALLDWRARVERLLVLHSISDDNMIGIYQSCTYQSLRGVVTNLKRDSHSAEKASARGQVEEQQAELLSVLDAHRKHHAQVSDFFAK
jgi:hypothetical protein